MTEQRLLTRPEVAKIVGLGVRTLERWARQGIGPVPVKAGPRAVRYRREDVDAWLNGLPE
jgi:excisionase family DNA binding protein